MKQPTKARLKEIIITLDQMHKQRCLMFGCIYGIPGIDVKPAEKCIYCGQPMPDTSDFWDESISAKPFIFKEYFKKLSTKQILEKE